MKSNPIYLKLSNNIEFISSQNEALNSICIGLYFKTSVIYENSKNNGISHLCEHMFFRRLNQFSQSELYKELENNGLTMYAKTYSDFVGFHIKSSVSKYKNAFKIIIQILSDFEWTQSELDSEKNVVKNQINFNVPSFSEHTRQQYFNGIKRGMNIMGSFDTLDNISVEDINDWKKNFFNTNNLMCVLTGNFSESQKYFTVKTLENLGLCDNRLNRTVNILPKSFGNRSETSDKIISSNWDISDISISFDIDKNEINLNCAELLCSILGQGVGSRLSMVLREQESLTDEIVSNVETYRDFSRLNIEFSAMNKELERALLLAFGEIAVFKNNISQKDLDSSIIFFTENQKFMLDSTDEYNFYLAMNWFVLNKKESISESIDKFKQITVYELIIEANKMFIPKNLIITVTNNAKKCKRNKVKEVILKCRNLIDNTAKKQNTGDQNTQHKGTVLLSP